MLGAPGDPARTRFTQSTDAEVMSVLSGEFKLTTRAEPRRLVAKSQPPRELYRLDRDPAEVRNLIEESPGVVSALEALLTPHRAAPTAAPDPEAEEQLRAMGYVR
jgi:hypothetical protein